MMNCPSCNHDGAVFHCTHCGHNWDDGRLEKLEEVAKAANKLIFGDGFTSVYWRELAEALDRLKEYRQ